MPGIDPPPWKALEGGNKEVQRVFHKTLKKCIPWVKKRDSLDPLCTDLLGILHYPIGGATEIHL